MVTFLPGGTLPSNIFENFDSKLQFSDAEFIKSGFDRVRPFGKQKYIFFK